MALTIRDKQVLKYRDEEKKTPIVIYEFICDKVSDLPIGNVVEGEEISQGSLAWIIELGAFYGLTSTGTWVNQTSQSEQNGG